MKDRVVLLTGASRGIGAATAKLLGEHGAAVAVNYHTNEDAARGVVAAVEAAGGRAIPVQADVRARPQVEAMVRRVSDELGPIDTLVLNAAIQFPVLPFTEYPWEAFEAKLVGELSAAFFCCKAVVPTMIDAAAGVHHCRQQRTVAAPGIRLLRSQHGQVGARRLCQVAGPRARPSRHPRQRRRARADHHRCHRIPAARSQGCLGEIHSAGSQRPAGGHCRGRSRDRCRHHRLRHRGLSAGERRHSDVVSGGKP